MIEVLLALGVLGIAGVALLTGFVTSITASAQHRSLATQNTSIPRGNRPGHLVPRAELDRFFSCSQTRALEPPVSRCTGSWESYVNPTTTTTSTTGPTTTSTTNPNDAFTLSPNASVQYWNGTSFQPGSCNASNPVPQLWTVTITAGGLATQANTVIYYNGPPTSTPGNCSSTPTTTSTTAGGTTTTTTAPATGCHLVFLQAPTGGVVNGNVSPQPIVAIEDVNNNIVAGDVSSITLSTCRLYGLGIGHPFEQLLRRREADGVVPFGSCSISNTGSYKLKTSDSNAERHVGDNDERLHRDAGAARTARGVRSDRDRQHLPHGGSHDH